MNASSAEINLKQPILGNTLIFLDTTYFRDLCSIQNEGNNRILKYAEKGQLELCTSRICIEEWRTQLQEGFVSELSKIIESIRNLKESNRLARETLEESFKKLSDIKKNDTSNKIVDSFIEKYKIRIFPYKAEHIEPTWNGYFTKSPPFKNIKSRNDIPDAWICEAAKDASKDLDYANKIIFSTDSAVSSALNDHFTDIQQNDLIKKIENELEGIQGGKNLPERIKNNADELNNYSVNIESESSLGSLLSKALTPEQEKVWLKSLGFIDALNNPSHDALEDIIFKLDNIEKEKISRYINCLVDAGYIINTGNHYIMDNKDIGQQASEHIIDDIIKVYGGL